MHDTDHNNGNSRANTYFSLPNHTYEELERSINAYKKDMQSKFKTVLKTTVVANILHYQCISSCCFFPEPCYILQGWDICLGSGGSVSSQPPLSCRYLSSWAIISHRKCPWAKISSPLHHTFTGGPCTSCYETHPIFILQCAW